MQHRKTKMLTADMKRIVEEQLLGFVATTAPDGTPNVSPKGHLLRGRRRYDCVRRNPLARTIRNLRANPRVEINFVDPFMRKGYRFAGTAMVVERGDGRFDALLGHYRGALAPRLRAIVAVTVTRALPLTSPVYDGGAAEPDVRRGWTTRFRKLQPDQLFTE
jgi:predicted pyridoxine 5'-phosphate oxidase superfamily flavin-nucleotide-binding protein